VILFCFTLILPVNLLAILSAIFRVKIIAILNAIFDFAPPNGTRYNFNDLIVFFILPMSCE